MTPKILVTGGTGFAGSHLVDLLLKSTNADVHVTNFGQNDPYIETLLPADHIHQLNLLDFEATQELLSKLQPTHLYHLASIASVADSFEKTTSILQKNITLQFNLLESIRLHSPSCKVLTVTSAQVYDPFAGNPAAVNELHPLGSSNPYAVSKLSQDSLSQSYFYMHKLNVIRVRPFNHIGPRQQLGFVVSDFAHQIAKLEREGGGEISVGNLEAIRDFSDVSDIVSGYKVLMDSAQPGEAYNLGSDTGTKVADLLAKLIELSSVTIQVKVDKTKFRPADVPIFVCDSTKAKKLGYHSNANLETTLQNSLDYWRTTL